MNAENFHNEDKLGCKSPRKAGFVRQRKALAWFVAQTLLASSVVLPHNAMAGIAIAQPMDWPTFSAASQNWVPRADPLYGYTLPIMVPKDNFALSSQIVWTPTAPAGGVGSVDFQMIQGDRWVTVANENAGQAGISSQQMSDAIVRFPKNTDYIFAQYSPENTTAHITIQRIEKTPDGRIEVRVADFTPWHGEAWAADGDYRTPAEIAAKVAGHNPFINFEGSSKADPLFHNVSLDAVEVAVGHAMRKYHASLAYVAVSQSRLNQWTSSKKIAWGFKQKVTTHVDGYVKPRWFVATPMELTPGGASPSICVTPGAVPTTSCDDVAHVAIAGVSFSEWKGGNMPATEDMVSQWSQSKSGFTGLFYAVILGGDFVGYSLLSQTFGSGGNLSSILGSYQTGAFGSSGNGLLAAPGAGSVAGQYLINAVNTKLVTPQMGASGSLSGTQALYSGTCPAGFTVGQCNTASLDPGTAWRPDSYVEYNTTHALRQRMKYCTDPVGGTSPGLGLTGVAAEKCAAPAAMQF